MEDSNRVAAKPDCEERTIRGDEWGRASEIFISLKDEINIHESDRVPPPPHPTASTRESTIIQTKKNYLASKMKQGNLIYNSGGTALKDKFPSLIPDKQVPAASLSAVRVTAEVKRKGDFIKLQKQVSALGGTAFRLTESGTPRRSVSEETLGSEPISALQEQKLTFEPIYNSGGTALKDKFPSLIPDKQVPAASLSAVRVTDKESIEKLSEKVKRLNPQKIEPFGCLGVGCLLWV